MLAVWLPVWILSACAVAIGVACLVQWSNGSGRHNTGPGHVATVPVLVAQMAAELAAKELKAAEEAAAQAAARAACESTQTIPTRIEWFDPRQAA